MSGAYVKANQGKKTQKDPKTVTYCRFSCVTQGCMWQWQRRDSSLLGSFWMTMVTNDTLISQHCCHYKSHSGVFTLKLLQSRFPNAQGLSYLDNAKPVNDVLKNQVHGSLVPQSFNCPCRCSTLLAVIGAVASTL